MRLLCFTMVLLVLPVLAFTSAETNQVVKSLLNRIMADAYDDDWTDEPKIILPQQRIDTWETFIGGKGRKIMFLVHPVPARFVLLTSRAVSLIIYGGIAVGEAAGVCF